MLQSWVIDYTVLVQAVGAHDPMHLHGLGSEVTPSNAKLRGIRSNGSVTYSGNTNHVLLNYSHVLLENAVRGTSSRAADACSERQLSYFLHRV